ncbi:MAG: S41 family peptidase [Anaerolineales bacterium]|nr:S41 family peptidase [Anaerolineales bacterium]
MASKRRSTFFGIMFGLIVSAGLLVGGFTAGFLTGTASSGLLSSLSLEYDFLSQRSVEAETLSAEASPSDLEELFQPFWESWDILHANYVDQPLDDVQLMQGAIEGLLESLGDPHTSYMTPGEYEQATMDLDSSYEGIGAWVDTDAEYLTIIAPMAGSPAEAAGLLPGDQVIAINGEDMTGLDGNVVVRQVLGPAGTAVVLTILREEVEEPFDVEIIRAEIELRSVEYELLPEDIGYIQLTTFGEETTLELQAALRELLAAEPSGLILDLRGNGGGYLQTAIEVASEFIDEGVILTERFGNGQSRDFNSLGNGLATEIPLVVLINQGSASASEIVAGAIQDYARGVLIGEDSFGKGSVQNWIPLTNDNGAVRVTIARWYTPADRIIHEVGLSPDVFVEFSMEDWELGVDNQLQAAIQFLLDA